MTGKLWAAGFVLIAGLSVLFLVWEPWLRVADHLDTGTLRIIAVARDPWLTNLAGGIKVALSGWVVTVLGIGLVVALGLVRRWRHLLVFLGSLFVLEMMGGILNEVLSRPRPYGIRIIGGWGGFAMPSPPVAVLALLLVAVAYTIVPQGRLRNAVKLAILALVGVFTLARLYLAVDHPSDALFGIILGVSIPLIAFRTFTPTDAFPVAYRRGKSAHLDVGGARGDAIRQAVRDQLGLEVLEIEPFGLEGSGGSTPLRLQIDDRKGAAGSPAYVFAKLYAKSHVRADRWYKMWRTILYGKLEDEASFQSVRRFAEYEDYTLRVMRDAGVPSTDPYGVVEISPGREYMIVMGFVPGAKEIGDAAVDDAIIDQGLALVRRLWDAGLAHRDIKPANLLVKDGRLILIDAFFVQVRPSPWRQAVDLANMMLVLAVRSDPERVYRRALAFFSPDEIAEAFAAARGVASPTQLRVFMKRDGRDLIGRFRALAPSRRPIAVQRWSVRRVAIAVGLFLAFALALTNGVKALLPAQNLSVDASPDCGANHTMLLMAQAIPSATSLPCMASLPSGWSFGGADVHSGLARFWLNSDRAGFHSAVVTLAASCNLTGALPVPTDEVGTLRFEKPLSLRPRFVDERFYRFRGGCITYRFDFGAGVPSTLVFEAEEALGFTERADLVSFVRRSEGLELCGAGARCAA